MSAERMRATLVAVLGEGGVPPSPPRRRSYLLLWPGRVSRLPQAGTQSIYPRQIRGMPRGRPLRAEEGQRDAASAVLPKEQRGRRTCQFQVSRHGTSSIKGSLTPWPASGLTPVPGRGA